MFHKFCALFCGLNRVYAYTFLLVLFLYQSIEGDASVVSLDLPIRAGYKMVYLLLAVNNQRQGRGLYAPYTQRRTVVFAPIVLVAQGIGPRGIHA